MVDSTRLNREVSYGGNCAPGGNDSDLGSYFLSSKAERLQTEVKLSVPSPSLNGIGFTRFVVVGREQAKSDTCATALDRYRKADV
jgi:hypothetical protein